MNIREITEGFISIYYHKGEASYPAFLLRTLRHLPFFKPERFFQQIDALEKEFQAHFTFFVLGKVAHSRQKALLTLEKAGHEIASHSFHHYSALSLEAKEFEQELIQSLAALQFLEQRPLGYRSPHLLMKENHYSLLHAYGFRYSSSQWGRLSTPYEIRPQLFERPVHFMDCHYLGKKAQMLSAFQDSLVAGSIHALHPYIALHPLYEKALFSLIKAQTLPLISIREQNEGKSGIALSFDIGF